MVDILPIHTDLFKPILKYMTSVDLIQETGKCEVNIEIPANLNLDTPLILFYFEDDVTLSFLRRGGPTILKGTIKSKELSQWLVENIHDA